VGAAAVGAFAVAAVVAPTASVSAKQTPISHVSLGLDPNKLDAVKAEGTQTLPGLGG
jgi:hypothetical protein